MRTVSVTRNAAYVPVGDGSHRPRGGIAMPRPGLASSAMLHRLAANDCGGLQWQAVPPKSSAEVAFARSRGVGRIAYRRLPETHQ